MTTSDHVMDIQEECIPTESPAPKKDSNYFSPSRIASMMESIIKKPIKAVSINTIGYYPNKY